MTLLSLKNIHLIHHDFPFLENINLDLKDGEIYGLIGQKNKRLLLQLMTGLIKPTHGSITYFGQPIQYGESSYLSDVGIATDDVYFYKELTGAENLLLYLEPYKKKIGGRDQISMPARIDKYFRRFDMVDSKNQPVRKYSMGMIQKLKLIRALIIEPKILILDEPFKSLDPSSVRDLMAQLKFLAKEKAMTVFITSSMLTLLSPIVDRIGLLHKGTISDQLDIEDLKINQQAYLMLRTKHLPYLLMVLECELQIFDYEVIDDERVHVTEKLTSASEIIKFATSKGVVFQEVKYGFESLEDYFIHKMGEL